MGRLKKEIHVSCRELKVRGTCLSPTPSLSLNFPGLLTVCYVSPGVFKVHGTSLNLLIIQQNSIKKHSIFLSMLDNMGTIVSNKEIITADKRITIQ